MRVWKEFVKTLMTIRSSSRSSKVIYLTSKSNLRNRLKLPPWQQPLLRMQRPMVVEVERLVEHNPPSIMVSVQDLMMLREK